MGCSYWVCDCKIGVVSEYSENICDICNDSFCDECDLCYSIITKNKKFIKFHIENTQGEQKEKEKYNICKKCLLNFTLKYLRQ